MARNGSGTMVILNTFNAGDTITASGHNQNNTDIASEITNSLALDGQSIMTGQIKAANGTQAAPGISIGSDLDCGVWRAGADHLGIGVGNTQLLDITTTAVGALQLNPLTSDGGALGSTSKMWADLFLAAGGVVNWNNGALTLKESSGSIVAASTVSGANLQWNTTDAGATGPVFTLYHNSASPAASDAIGVLNFNGNDSGGNATGYCQFYAQILDTTDGSEDGRFVFNVIKAGTLSSAVIMDGTGITVTGAVSGSTVAGNLVASQSDQETGTSTSKVVTPGTQQFHQSAGKTWIKCDNAGGILESYNVTSISDTGTGQVTITIATDFSSTQYAVVPGVQTASGSLAQIDNNTSPPTAGTFRVNSRSSPTANLEDPNCYFAVAFGDHA